MKTTPENTPQNKRKNAAPQTGQKRMNTFLRRHGCKHDDWEDTSLENEKSLNFRYHSYQFTATADTQSKALRISHYNLHEETLNHPSRMERMANHYNSVYDFYKIIAGYDAEENVMWLDVHYEALQMTHDDIIRFLDFVPALKQRIANDIEKGLFELSAEEESNFARRMHLIREAELDARQELPFRASSVTPLTLGLAIEHLFGCNEADLLVGMYVFSAQQNQHITDNFDVWSFDLVSVVYDHDRRRMRQPVVLKAWSLRYQYILNIDPVSQHKSTAYFRLTVTQLPVVNPKQKRIVTEPAPHSVTMLYAYDKRTEKNRHAEYRYMLADAKDKIANGKRNELSPEQQLIVGMDDDPFSEAVYFGRKHYNAKRFFEAACTLLPVFAEMKKRFYQLEQRFLDRYYEICFLIGSSYNHLAQYDRACYYLEIAWKANRFEFAREYINALVNGLDPKIFSVTDFMMQVIVAQAKIDNISEEHIEYYHQFSEFMSRRRGFALIEFGRLDEAEQLLNSLLDSPDSGHYARTQLDRIAHLRELQKTSC